MSCRKGTDYTNDDVLKEIYICATEVFTDGIAVPDNSHPCGWSWIDFDGVDDILTYKFKCEDINNNFGDSELEGMTLKEILIKANGRFLFEINTYVDWEEDWE